MSGDPSGTAYVVYDRRNRRRVVSPDGQWEVHQEAHEEVLDSPVFGYQIITWGDRDGE